MDTPGLSSKSINSLDTERDPIIGLAIYLIGRSSIHIIFLLSQKRALGVEYNNYPHLRSEASMYYERNSRMADPPGMVETKLSGSQLETRREYPAGGMGRIPSKELV